MTRPPLLLSLRRWLSLLLLMFVCTLGMAQAQETEAEAEAPPAATAPAEEPSLVAEGGLLDLLFDYVERGVVEARRQGEESWEGLRQLPQDLARWGDALPRQFASHGWSWLGVILLSLIVQIGLNRLLRTSRQRLAAAGARRSAQVDIPPPSEPKVRADGASSTAAWITDAATPPENELDAGQLRVAAGMSSTDESITPAASEASQARWREDARQRQRLFQRLPFALMEVMLSLVPWLTGIAVAALGLAWLDIAGTPLHRATTLGLSAYLHLRLALAALDLLCSHHGPGLRLLDWSDDQAERVHAWLAQLFSGVAIGVALGGISQALGAGPGVSVLIFKLTSLCALITVLCMLFALRHDLRAWLHRISQVTDDWRSQLTRALAWIALVFLVVVWVAWTFGVAGGFRQSLSFFGITAGVLIGTRIVSILVLGWVDRAFGADQQLEASGLPGRYYAVLRNVTLVLLTVLTLFALLLAWGVPVMSVFSEGTLARRLLSAVLTISCALVVAVLIWEVMSYALMSRIKLWHESGDTVRAARLRTLVPMLRTILMVLIGLVLLLTVLHELGINIAPLLAGASIIGIAVGFGSQKLVQDFITGVFLLMENAMQVGDSVTLAGLTGTVEHLSVRTVRLRAGDGTVHIIPFSSVGTVSNAFRGSGVVGVKVSVSPDTDPDQLAQVLRELGAELRADPAVGPLMTGDIEINGVESLSGSSITMAATLRTTDRARQTVLRAFNRLLLRRLQAEKIRLARSPISLVEQVPG